MILITGGLGFIGLHTARAFIDAGHDVVLTQHRNRREPKFLKDDLGKHAFIEQLDVTDADAFTELGRRYEIDHICHLAGPGYNAPSPAIDFRVNVFGLLNVLEAARTWRVKRTTLASSIATYYYGGAGHGPFREDMPLRMTATNPIETFKKADELLAAHYADRTGIDVAMMRIALIYGPLHPYGNIAYALTRAAVDRAPPRFAAPSFVEDTTDLCHVSDCARAIVMLQLAPSLAHRTYNIGDGKATSFRTIAETLEGIEPGTGLVETLQPGRGPTYQDDRYMDLSRIKTEVGYEPQYTLERGLREYADWLRDHLE